MGHRRRRNRHVKEVKMTMLHRCPPRASSRPLRPLTFCRHGLPLLALLVAGSWNASAAADPFAPPPVMLANVHHAEDTIDFADYWVSEKLDGVRAYWDGDKLLTRGGNRIAAPAWFTAGWPTTPLDGELWAGRGRFEHASATTRRDLPDDRAWREMRYMVFDLPAHGGTFDDRLAALGPLVRKTASPWMQPVAQFKLAGADALHAKLKEIVALGGEGLMLHRGRSRYRAERNDDLLKFKPYEDAEAKVVGHLPGNGKYEGLLGALLVQRPDGLQFRLGSGFTDEQRRVPPPVGSWVTYAYNGTTEAGVPRFARFVRVRDDMGR